jgi:hypothetical protein
VGRASECTEQAKLEWAEQKKKSLKFCLFIIRYRY